MNENHLNTSKGRDFQYRVRVVLEGYFDKAFELEVPLSIGTPPKPHRFDCVSTDRKIVVECKCHSWTAGGNVPSAKMATINEAAFYMSFLPADVRPMIVMKKTALPKRPETLAEYYCRTNGHLLGRAEVFELDDDGVIHEIKLNSTNVIRREDVQPRSEKSTEISNLWNHGSEEDWKSALDYYGQSLRPANAKLENEFEKLDTNHMKEMPADDFFHFLYNGYFVWKYTAVNRLATTRANLNRYRSEGRMDDLERIKNELFSFDRDDIHRGLEIARGIYGLGTAGASGLLSILFPKDFGTVDQFVVKSLLSIKGIPEYGMLSDMKPEGLNIHDGVKLIRIMRNKAWELNERFGSDSWTPRKIDKILWSIGR